MSPDAERDGDSREQRHEEAQPQKERAELDERACGEIDGDTHGQPRSAPATPASEPRGMEPVTAPAPKAEASMSSRTRTAPASLYPLPLRTWPSASALSEPALKMV